MAEIADSTLASEIHELTGSSPSTGVKPYFKPVAKPQPRPQVRPRLGPDVAVFELAARVKSLGRRHSAMLARVQGLIHQVEAAHPKLTPPVSNEAYHAYYAEIRPTEDRIGLVYLRKVRCRMMARLVRWTKRLTTMEPWTLAGLGAKADAASAVRAENRFDTFPNDLIASVSRDAVRLAAASVEPAISGDASFISLVAQYTAAMTEWEAADDASDAPRDAYFSSMPPRPQALYWNAADRTRPARRVRASVDSFHLVYDEDDVERMREKPATRVIEHRRPADWNPDDTIVRSERVPDEPGEARRLQIIAAYDGWEADLAALRDSTGLTAANALVEAAAEVLNDLEDTILRATPHTLLGFQAKARWIARRANPATLGIHLIRDLCSMPTVAALAPVSSEPSLDVIESYRTYLDQELRWLNWETHGSAKAIGGIWLDNPAARLHGGDGPPPSSRATTVLSVLGLMPDRASETLAEVEDQIAARVA